MYSRRLYISVGLTLTLSGCSVAALPTTLLRSDQKYESKLSYSQSSLRAGARSLHPCDPREYQTGVYLTSCRCVGVGMSALERNDINSLKGSVNLQPFFCAM